MKRKILLIILIFSSLESYCQMDALDDYPFDSVHLYYYSCYGLDVKILFTKDSISVFQMIRPTDRINQYDLIYKIKKWVKIIDYFNCLRTIFETEPIDNNKEPDIIPECQDSMDFLFYSEYGETERQYLFNYYNLYPFGFTILYLNINQIIKTHKRHILH